MTKEEYGPYRGVLAGRSRFFIQFLPLVLLPWAYTDRWSSLKVRLHHFAFRPVVGSVAVRTLRPFLRNILIEQKPSSS